MSVLEDGLSTFCSIPFNANIGTVIYVFIVIIYCEAR